MPELSFENTLQVCILVAGIYLVLSLLRTTRGSGLVRALGIALLIFGVGMYSLVRTLELEELEQVLDAIFGVVIIMLVVLFQPELRRGILRLGEHGILRRFLGTDTQETVGEITAAVATMARKKQGALIAIERQTPLDQYIDHGVHLDAAVDKVLLDSIFFDKGALHDGAVIIRGDRIVAGGAILPLSENTKHLEVNRHPAPCGPGLGRSLGRGLCRGLRGDRLDLRCARPQHDVAHRRQRARRRAAGETRQSKDHREADHPGQESPDQVFFASTGVKN